MIFTPTNFINGERKMKNKSYSFREDPYKIEKLIKFTGAKRDTEAIKIAVEFFFNDLFSSDIAKRKLSFK